MECPSLGVRTMSTPEDSEGTAEGEVYGLMWNGGVSGTLFALLGYNPLWGYGG